MPKITIGNAAFYGALGALIADTTLRATTNEGFIEKLPNGMQILEYFNLVQQKAAGALAEFSQNFDRVGREHLEGIVDSIGVTPEEKAGFESKIDRFVEYLKERPQKLEEISSNAGYVVNKANNIKVAVIASFIASLIGLGKAAYSRFMGKQLTSSSSQKSKIDLEDEVTKLTGIYAKINPDEPFFDYANRVCNMPYNTKDSEGEKVLDGFRNLIESCELNRDNTKLSVAPGTKVGIFYLVPGDNDFALKIGSNVKGEGSVSSNKFYIGSSGGKFMDVGIHDIKLNIGERQYTTKVTVKNPTPQP